MHRIIVFNELPCLLHQQNRCRQQAINLEETYVVRYYYGYYIIVLLYFFLLQNYLEASKLLINLSETLVYNSKEKQWLTIFKTQQKLLIHFIVYNYHTIKQIYTQQMLRTNLSELFHEQSNYLSTIIITERKKWRQSQQTS